MKFAAVDIGSNGARMLISRVLVENSSKTSFVDEISFKDVEYIRFALRLGVDVFTHKRITEAKEAQLMKLMQAFKLIMELHEVDDHMVLATSAFREAKNGEKLVKQVKKEVGLTIDVINGVREAEILSYIIVKFLDPNKNYIHIDVGGGSTELNLYVCRERVACKSFPMGSIRNIENDLATKTFQKMQDWAQKQIAQHCPEKEVLAIGTGGNINKVYNLINPSGNIVNQEEIRTLRYYLNNFSLEERINIFKLNPDRADTIIPASYIYLSVMEWCNAQNMIVPKVGLKDGMMQLMLRKNWQGKPFDEQFC